MKEYLKILPSILLLNWIPLTSQQGIISRINRALLSILFTLTAAQQGQAHVISPTYSSVNTVKAARSTLGKPLCPNTLDIVIAIDSSESVQTVWNNIIDDAESFIRSFQVADHLTRIGIVDFSAVANVYSPLDSNNTVESAHRVLEKLRSRPQNGETWVELGLDRASEVFDNATPPRPKARKVLVMYTDGESTSRDYNSLKDLVKHQREQEIETFVVTVTNTSYQPGLQIMASSFAHIYHMGKQVQIGQPTLSEGVCWGQGVVGGPSLNFVDPSQTQNLSPEKSKCEREREGAQLVIQSKVPTLVPIFVPECESNGKYKVIQRHVGTGFYWCVNSDTGEIINGTRTINELPNCPPEPSNNTVPSNFTPGAIEYDNFKNNTRNGTAPTATVNIFKNFSQAQKEGEPIIKYIPPIVLSKCQEERETATEILNKKIPSSVPVMVPECEAAGMYKQVQGDGNGYSWCVDPKRGEIINGTKKYKDQPTCPDSEPPKRPQTNCESERDENLKKVSSIPDIHIPECSVFDGLYLEIQRIWVGAKYCVNRYTGDHIKGTDTEIGKPDPVCPEMTKCEKMQVEIHTHNYRNLTRPAILRRDVPICKRNGLFEEVQSSLAIEQYWCVNKITGMYIEGTLTYDKKPECPGVSNNAMSSYISSLAEGSQPGFLSSFYNVTQPVNNTDEPISQVGHNSNGGVNRPLTNCQRQQIEKLKVQNVTLGLHILQCSDYDGLYMEIQTSPRTGRKYCVTRYTGDYIKGTEVAPGPVNPKCPVKSKCEHEREKIHTYNYRNYDRPGFTERTILHCNQNGFYNLLQSDNKTHVNWCVDELTGEYISPSVMHYPRVPDCAKVSPPHTRCEREKAESGRKQLVLPDTFVPRCNVFNGLYADIQYMPSGWKWCVDKFSGERIGSTDTEPGPQEPLCPELSNCEREKVEAHTYNFRNFSNNNYLERFVPVCDVNGLYASIQTNKNLSMAWCADKVTGEYINGTTKNSWQGKPTCPDGIPPVCLQPKLIGPCKGVVPKTFFNPETATCEAFAYGGCNGNDNNFNSLQECETKCGSVTKCLIQKERATATKDTFIPSCMVDGSYQQLQHHPNGSSWCADTETGQIIPNTLTSGTADCSRVPVQVEPRREATCIEDNERIFGKRVYPIVGVYIPQCTVDGFYDDIQHYTTTGEMWCVHRYTGVQIEGTLMKLGDKVPNCPKHPNVDCLLPKEPGACKGLFPRYYYDWQKNRCIRFNYGGCQGNANNFKNFRLCERTCKDMPQFPCQLERDFANQERMKYNIIGGFLPSCDPNGNYRALQYNASSGEQWCVDVHTGHEVVPTRMMKGEFDLDCLNLTNAIGTMQASDTQAKGNYNYSAVAHQEENDNVTTPLDKMPVGVPAIMHFPVPEPEPSPAKEKGPKAPNKYLEPENDTDIYHPKQHCVVELDFAKQKDLYSHAYTVFKPQCDDKGNYLPLQTQGSEGNKWCVDILTGAEIIGTRVGVNGPDPDCPNDVKSSGDTLQRHEISKNESTPAPNVISEKESSPQQKDDGTPGRNSIAPLQNVIPIENVIAPLKNESSTDNETSLFRNEISPVQNDSLIFKNGSTFTEDHSAASSVQNGSTSTEEHSTASTAQNASTSTAEHSEAAAPVQNASAVTADNATKIANMSADAKEGMKDLGEAIGSLFGGLFSAMMPIMNATTNTSDVVKSPNTTSLQNNSSEKGNSMFSKERSELNDLDRNCPYEIGVNLTKLGCWNDDQQVPRPLPVLIFNDTAVKVDAEDWRSLIRSLICKCAMITRERGWYTFGVQNYGECFSGPDEGRYKEDGEAPKDMCINEGRGVCDENDTQACAGIQKTDKGSGTGKDAHANYVFMIVTETHKEVNYIHYDRRKRKRSINSRINAHKRQHRRH